MKKHSILLTILLGLLLSACGGMEKTSSGDASYILTSYNALPKNITYVSQCYFQDNKLYLCCREEADEDDTVSYVATMNSDGSDFQKLPLDFAEHEIVLDIVSKDKGGIWTVCLSRKENEEPNYTLCGFDNNQKRIVEKPLNSLLEETGALRYAGKDLYLNANKNGELCIVARDGKTSCFLFDRDGNYLFTLRDGSDPHSVITTASGEFAVWSTANGGGNYFLNLIDMENYSWGVKIETGSAASVFSGYGDTDYYLFDSSELFRCNIEAETKESLFNWVNLGLASGDAHICPLSSGSFAVIAGSYSQTNLLSYEFSVAELGQDDRTVLTMLSLQPENSLLEAIALFNKNNDQYKVELTSYFPKDENVTADGWNNAITNLNTKLMSGEVPDLMDLANMPVDVYSRRGILEDLYPYLQNDPEINLNDYFENVFESFKIDGKLPYVSSSVRILSMFADERAVGITQGWTVDQFAAMKNDSSVIMHFFPPNQLLKLILGVDDSFLDLQSGKCDFDNGEFTGLLESCLSQATADTKWTDDNGNFTAKANCYFVSLDSVLSVAYYNKQLEGKTNPIGIPSLSGESLHILEPANKIGFSSACEHKDGAWSFVRSFLEPKLQESGWYFPYLKSSFDKITAEAMKGNSVWVSGIYGDTVEQRDIDLAKELLSRAKYCANADQELINMIVDLSANYFSGGGDVQSVAAEVQRRASLYVSEYY